VGRTGKVSKQQIIETSAGLFHFNGYNHTSLDMIAKKLDLQKGSISFHFPSKEDLAIAVLDYQFEKTQNNVFAKAFDGPGNPIEKVEKFFDCMNEEYFKTSSNLFLGCPLGTFSMEMSTVSNRIRERIVKIFDSLVGKFESVLNQAKEEGLVPEEVDTHYAAIHMMVQVQGASLVARTYQNLDVLQFLKQGFYNSVHLTPVETA